MNPHSDWRVIANAVKDYPACSNCGDPYGNVYFGASHWCEQGYAIEPPVSDPRPDPRTHPEHWAE